MKRFFISMTTVALGLAMTTATQAKGPGGKGGSKFGGGFQSSASQFKGTPTGTSFKTTKQNFSKGNQSFYSKSYFKNFTYRWWCKDYGCYYYWCPTSCCYFYWYEPYACYCPIDYVTVAPPVVVTQQASVVQPAQMGGTVPTPGAEDAPPPPPSPERMPPPPETMPTAAP